MSFTDLPPLRHLGGTSQRALIIRLREAVAPILANNLLPHFTDHSVTHSDRLTQIVDDLIAPIQHSSRQLNAQELVVLYSACYLHDIGMQYENAGQTKVIGTVGLEQLWTDLSEDMRRELLRTHHHQIAAELVIASVDSGTPPIGIQLLPEYDPSSIACLCEAHATDSESPRYAELVSARPNLRMALLSGLLRVGDILEESRRRASLTKARSLLLDANAQVHWWRHYYTEDIILDPDKRKIVIWFDFPQARLTEYKDVVPPLQLPSIREELSRHQAAFAEGGVGWSVEATMSPKQHSDAKTMPEEVLCAMLKALHRQQLVEAEKKRAVLVGTFVDARPHLQRRLEALNAQRDVITNADYITQLADLASDMWGLGAKRSAWTTLQGPFEKNRASLPAHTQVDLGIRLATMMREDGEGRQASQLLSQLAQIVEEKVSDTTLQFQYFRLLAACLIENCGYNEAQTAIKRTIVLASSDKERATMEAELSELHFLQGELDSALHAASERSTTDD